MMEKTNLRMHGRGLFALRICVDDKSGNTAQQVLEQFIHTISPKYDLQVIQLPTPLQPDAHRTEAVIAVPFPDKENVRIDFNIFASEVEDQCGDAFRYYFYMESVPLEKREL